MTAEQAQAERDKGNFVREEEGGFRRIVAMVFIILDYKSPNVLHINLSVTHAINHVQNVSYYI